MRRFRSIVLLMALLAGLPGAYLIRGAHRGLEQAERDAFRRIARARFDRIEAELSGLLEEEELRAFADYSGVTLTPRQRDEMAGWFQINPDQAFVPYARLAEEVEEPMAANRRLGELGTAYLWYRDRHLTRELVLPEARPFLPDVPVARMPEVAATVKGGTSYSGKGGTSYSGKGGTAPAPAVASAQEPQPAAPRIVHERDDAAARAAEAVHLRGAAGAMRLEVDPVIVLPVDARLLLGVRRVWADQEQYRQCFVLRAEPLVHRLAGMAMRAFHDSGDARLRVVYDHGPATVTWVRGALDAPSRFYAERSLSRPFDCFRIRIDSSGVADGFSRTAFWSVVGTLLAVGLLGLVAIDRALASLVDSARRRQGFVSSVTHELKTPLTTIRMYGEMLRDGVVSDPQRQREYHAAIASEGERLSRLVDNVLDLAKLEKGSYRFRSAPGDAGEVVAAVAETLGVYAASLGFRLRTEIDSDLPLSRFDRDALVQVLVNLTDNALKFARDHEPREVTLVATRQLETIVLAVCDHGPGLPPRELGRVLSPFYRTNDGLTRDTRGSGLGLGLVRLLVEGMGGVLTLRNREGGGLEATVTLPCAATPGGVA